MYHYEELARMERDVMEEIHIAMPQ